MNKIFFLILFSLTLAVQAAESDYQGTFAKSEIILDCSNYRIYDFDLTNKYTFDNTQPGTFTKDTIISQLSQDSTGYRINIWADLGSETGEPLFIRFQKSATNKEHMVYAGSEMHLLKDKLQLRGGYHHLGSYSDRIDNKLIELTQHYGYSPKYQGTGSFGISEYYFGIWKLSLDNVNTRGIIRKYGNWVLLPVNYDPVYISGYRYAQDFSISGVSDIIMVNADINMQRKYLDHLHSESDDIFTYDFLWKHKISQLSNAGVECNGNTDADQGYLFRLYLDNKINENLGYYFKAGLWTSGEPQGECNVNWNPNCKLNMNFNMQYAYKPSQKTIHYLSADGPADIKFEPIRETRMMSFFECMRIFDAPLSCRGWTLFQAGSPEYAIIGGDSIRSIIVRQSDEFIAAMGGKINTQLHSPSKSFLMNSWIMGNCFFSGQLPEEVPFEAGSELSYVSGKNKENRYTVKLTYRTPYSVHVNVNGHDEIRESKQNLFMNLSIDVPFVSPLFSKHIKPAIRLSAGPVHLLHDTRQAFHPYGADMGPAISAKMFIDLM